MGLLKKFFAVMLLYLTYQFFTPNERIEIDHGDSKYSFEYVVKDSSSLSLPILFLLHGNGDTPKNFYEGNFEELIDSFRIVLLKAPQKCYVGLINGTCWPREKSEIAKYYSAMRVAIHKIHQSFPHGDSKPYLLGYSAGASAAYFFASNSPNYYSVIVPVSGMLNQSLIPKEIPKSLSTKIIAFHGIKDQIIEFHNAKLTVEAMQKSGSSIRLHKFDGGHHGLFKEQKNEIFNILKQNL
ncbi:MAG: dienelactone hydrolase family protein [Bdellovibrionota bacterium]|nr:dienelactone hydrolase family protein [Bdellovibrionota bacterium]